MPSSRDPNRFENEDAEQEDIDETGREIQSYRVQKDAVILAVEVSESMLAPPPCPEDKKADRDSPVQAALKCAHLLMEELIISNSKDMIGILLFGTRQSKFLGEGDFRDGLSYPGCYLLTPLDVPGAEDMRALSRLAKHGGSDSRVLDAADEAVSMSTVLFCVNQIFTTRAANVGSRRLFIITDNDNPHSPDRAAASAAAIRAKDLYDLDVSIHLFPIARDDAKFDTSNFYDNIVYSKTASENETSATVSRWGDGLTLLTSLMANISRKLSPKRALFSNLPLEIAPDLQISVKGYDFLHRQAPARTCYVWLDGEKAKIATGETKRMAEDSTRTVDKYEIKRVYTFGGEHVYLTPEEQGFLRDFGSPIIRIVGFKARASTPVWASVKKSIFIFPNEEEYTGSSRVFAALRQKLIQDDKIGLVWCITRAKAKPLLAALVPSEEQSDGDGGAPYLPGGLWIRPLPFADDMRESQLPTEACQSSDELKSRMSVVVQQLQLPRSRYNPAKYPNPALQWHYKILKALALDEEVPEKAEDRTVPRYKAISKRCGSYLEEWAEQLEEEAGLAASSRALKRETEERSPERPAKRKKTGAESVHSPPGTLAQLKAAVTSGAIARMKVSQLRDIADAQGLKSNGRKMQLVETIEQWVEEHA